VYCGYIILQWEALGGKEKKTDSDQTEMQLGQYKVYFNGVGGGKLVGGGINE